MTYLTREITEMERSEASPAPARRKRIMIIDPPFKSASTTTMPRW